MALQKQQVPVSFVGGIDTKTDDKQVVATKLLQLENGVFTKRGAVQKRFGYDQLSRAILQQDDSISTALGLSVLKNELLLFNGVKLYAYSESKTSWLEKGTISSVSIQNQSIIRNTFQQTDPDYAFNSNLSCYVWKDSIGGVRYSIFDQQSGSIIAENQQLSATGIKPRVVGIGNYFFIYYIDGNALKFQFIQISSPQIISVAVDLNTAIDPTDKIYDAQKVGDRVYIAYNSNHASGSVRLFYMTSNKTVSAEVEYIGEEAASGVSLASDSADNIWVSYYDGSDVKYFIQDYTLNMEVLAPTVIETVADVVNIASFITSVDEGTFLYEIDASPDHFIRMNTADSAGTAGTPSVFKRSVGLAGKMFTYQGEFYVPTVFSSDLQSTYFIFSLEGDIITKANNVVAGGYYASSILPTIVEIDTGKFIYPTLKKGILQTESGLVFSSLGINSTLIDFVSLNNFVTAPLAGSLHVVGGLLQTYDGNSVTETGFNIFPEDVTATEANAGAGSIANGDYQYSAVYGWVDNLGQLHRSAPSIPVTVTIAGGPSDVDVVVPTLRITKKQDVFIEVYRTEVNSGGPFYKVTSNTALLMNDETVDSVTFQDDTTDADLIDNEVLYITGGVLDNIAPPSSTVIVNWKNRLVVKSSDEENVVWYSKIRNENFPVEFNDSLRIVVDPDGGDISALGVLDEKLIIFKQNSIHMQTGDGPNNLGEQSDFGLPQKVASDVGCIDSNSVVQTPVGLLFKSAKGIYLLDRGLAVQYIGAEVEDFNSFRITAARLLADSNEVRFTTEDNGCLVYNYYFNQWSTFTNHEATGATIHNDLFTFVKSNGIVYRQNSAKFTDGAQAVKLRLVTSWMQLSELSGFQRIYKFLILGAYKSKHRLKVKMGYNFERAFTQESEIDVFGVLDPVAYGDSSPYGAEEVYGGRFPLYQWRFFPKRQKCTAFRISIEDVMDDVFGESFSISNLRMEIGVKQGSNKLSTERSSANS